MELSQLRIAGCFAAPLIMIAMPVHALAEPTPNVAPAPAWVREASIPAPNPAYKEQPLQLLLSSAQHHIGARGNESYFRTVAVPQTTAGLQALGNVSIPWNSERADLTVHHVLLRRGKETIDVLKGQELVVLRRENNLENSVLDGVRTVVLQIPGLQVGDLVDVALSQSVRPSSFGAKPESVIPIVEGAPIGMLDRRWLVTDGIRVDMRADPSLPLRTEKKAGSTEYAYSRADYEPPKIPSNAPLRYRIPAVQLTTYASWSEVAAVMKPLFDQARKPSASSPVIALADDIAKANATPEARMMAALRLAQEKVRYVALTLGEGAYVPATADQTWARKFGDCKGKTALLLALLDRLGIQAEPMLTSSETSALLADRLPSLDVFDHVLVRAHIGDRQYLLDATNFGQRTLSELLLPAFDWGLPLIDAAQIWRVPKVPPSYPLTETAIAWDASKGFDQQVPFTATLTYRDSAASFARAVQAAAPDRAALEKYLKNQIPHIDNEELQIEAIEADGKNGEFIVRLKGTAPMDWDRSIGGRQYYFDHSVPTWKPDIDRDSGDSKDLPVALGLPGWIRSVETVTLPRGGAGFTIKARPISETVAGIEIKRAAKLEGALATVVADFRKQVSEITAQDARTAQTALARIAKDYAYATAPKDYVVSNAEVRAIVSEEADSYGAYIDRARLLMDQSDRRRAIVELDKASKLDGKRPEAPALRSINSFFLGRYEEARSSLQQALRLDPEDVDVLRAQALIAWHDRDSALAIKAIDRAIEIDSEFHGHFAIRARIRAGLGQYDDALVDVRRAVELSADTMSVGEIAQYEAASGRVDQALATIEKAIASGRQDGAEIFVLKGDLLLQLGKAAEAKAAYRLAKEEMRAYLTRQFQAETGASDVPVSSDMELQLLIMTRNFDEAEPLAERKIANQRYPSALNLGRRAFVRVMNGKNEGAIADARNAMALDPSDETARNALILAFLRSGKFGDAEAQASKGLIKDVADPRLLYARAIARSKLGNAAGATADVQAARQLQFEITLDPAFQGLKVD